MPPLFKYLQWERAHHTRQSILVIYGYTYGSLEITELRINVFVYKLTSISEKYSNRKMQIS